MNIMKLLSCKDAEKSNNEPSDLTHPGQHVVKAVWTLLILIVVSFVMLWLGDNVYLRRPEHFDPKAMAARYKRQRGFEPLDRSCYSGAGSPSSSCSRWMRW